MAFAALSLASCSRTDCECFTAEKPEVVSDFTQRAQLLLDSYSLNTKAGSKDELFSFKLGDMDVDWSLPDYFDNRETEILGIENEILSYYEYRVLMPDGRMVNCDKELLYVKDKNSDKESLYLMYYIPDADYREVHDEDLAIRFKNDGCLEDYTGLKMYTTPDGVLVALNEYVEGECTKSLYLPELETEEDLINGYNLLISMMGGMTVQRLKPAAETKAFNKAVNEVDREFEFSGGELNPAVCRGSGGGGYSPSSIETWTWLAYCNSQTDSLKENGEDGRDNLGGGGNSNKNTDSAEDGKKETIEEIKDRLISKIVSKRGNPNDVARLKKLIELLLSTEEQKGSTLISDVLRDTKKLDSLIVCNYIYQVNEHDNASSTMIEVKAHLLDQNIALLEEFFHCHQRQNLNGIKDWGTGDLELEAKVYLAFVWEQFANELSVNAPQAIPDNLGIFIAFYNNPDSTTYKAACDQLEASGNYTNFNFMNRADSEYKELLKHLRGLEIEKKER